MLTQKLKLIRPLVLLDVETTGINPNVDRVVALAVRKHLPSGKLVEGYELLNPLMDIPESSTKIHGITNEMVEDKRLFSQIAPDFIKFLKDCDLGGYNVMFDLRMIAAEFKRCGITFDYSKTFIIDPFILWRKLESRDLTNAVARWCPEYEFTDAHDAAADIEATEKVLIAQLDKFEKPTPQSLSEYSYPEKVDVDGRFLKKEGIIHLNFGRHRGEPAKDHPGFLKWMFRGDFSDDTLAVAKKLLKEIEDE